MVARAERRPSSAASAALTNAFNLPAAHVDQFAPVQLSADTQVRSN